MAANNELLDRRVVPRWRTFRETVASGELSGDLVRKPRILDAAPFLQQKERDWLENKELPFAVDLVSAATMFGKSDTSISAADYILENQKKASNVAISLASELLGIDSPNKETANPVFQTEIREGLRDLKARRISQPGNAFVWTDLARLYVLLGQKEQARQAITVALKLAPSERFVIRSSARFFLHNNEQDYALRILRSNPRTPVDPWLTAAEIAVSSIVNKTPKFARLARELIQNENIRMFHKSELASSLASLELGEGSLKKANRLFQISLNNPTENAIAQYVWASKKNGLTAVNPKLLEVRNASEARTFDANNNAQWAEVVNNAHEWSRSEYFSARPRMIAATTASYFLENPEATEDFLSEGLKINPGHPGMVNSLAFSLAWRGEPEQAERIISTLDINLVGPVEAMCLIATAGLILIRSGKITEGKSLYEKAIATASKNGNHYLKSLAELHLSHEMVSSGDPKALQEFMRTYDNAMKQKTSNLPFIAVRLATRTEKKSAAAPENKAYGFMTKINAIIRSETPSFGPPQF